MKHLKKKMELVLTYFGVFKYLIYFQPIMPTYAFGNVFIHSLILRLGQ